MKLFWSLTVFAAIVLSGAAVVLGGINQDEGWYLYAANMLAAGKVLYRDFAYTQGPVLPTLYAHFAWIWKAWGLLGGRVFTLFLGLGGIVFAAATARLLAPQGRGNAAALVVSILLGCNLFHLYYLAIPKAYALASLLLAIGFYVLAWCEDRGTWSRAFGTFVAGVALSLTTGTRISMGAITAVVGLCLLIDFKRRRLDFLWFGFGGILGLILAFGPYLSDSGARAGLIAAQSYHTARGGSDILWVVGSLSRLFRWYLPAFVVLGLGVVEVVKGGGTRVFSISRTPALLLYAFLAVFVVQMLAPFPYEDYQVPVMGLLVTFTAILFVSTPMLLSASSPSSSPLTCTSLWLVIGLAFATAFGSPLLQKWTTNGQDRFWSRKKAQPEILQLRDVARRIEKLDPGGGTLLTQDVYLAVETGRTVPPGLEMGPFSVLTDAEWRKLLKTTDCPVAALSGYTFAVEPPVCNERALETQFAYWDLLKKRYRLAESVQDFGQNATTLLILRKKD